MSKVYAATSLIGGITGSLDNINGSALVDKDIAIVGVQGGNLMPYVLEADSGETEASPYIIAPDSNPGTKRWKLVGIQPAFSHVLATEGTGQTFISGTPDTVIFGTEVYDTLGEYNNTTGIFTAKYDGIYSFKACVTWDIGSVWNQGHASYLYAAIESTTVVYTYTPIQRTATFRISLTPVNFSYQLSAGETFQVDLLHNSGVNKSLQDSGLLNYLTIDRIA